MDICGQITFLYFDNLPLAFDFFENTLGLDLYKDQGMDFCRIYLVTDTSFIGCVNRQKGSVAATSRDGVLTTFVVKDLEGFYAKIAGLNLTGLTPIKVSERIGVKSATFFGPEGYKFEVQQFI